ncbi:MAG: AAA family ATPase [Christensenella sp.]|nr:AAA family ATPase [Christensenella sp.]
MEYVKQIIISGFKKFESFKMDFHDKTNIIVGENESGKSTVLEAICVVLHQWYRNSDKSIIKDLLNIEITNRFIKAPSVQTLPQIRIELELQLNETNKNARRFYGTYGTIRKSDTFGIVYECRLSDEYDSEIETEIMQGKIPYEYYSMSWRTFHGDPYSLLLKPFKAILVDPIQYDGSTAFSSFSKNLFNEKYDEGIKARARYDFREKTNQALEELGLEPLSEEQKFGISNKKLILDNLVSVLDNAIPLENKGRGMEHIIKTRIALKKAKSQLSLVLIEEPENHLSYTTLLRMIKNIEESIDHNQLIITTHNNLIASRLNLRNVLWIDKGKANSLKDVDTKIADYFMKADNNNFLNLLLAEKIILVEGAAEFIILPFLFKQVYGRAIEEENITIISCNGLAFKNYLGIAEKAEKRVAVVTDNDNKADRIKTATKYNADHSKQHIFMAEDLNDWTWEVVLYNLNKDTLDKTLPFRKGSKYSFCKVPYDDKPVLGIMLNNKAAVAYKLVTENTNINIPQYVKDAFEWVRK